jgi:hypothetical protein
MSEYLRHNWESLRAAGDPKGFPQSIQNLAQAQTEEEALQYYHQLENYAVLQGSVYEASYPVVICLMQELVRCTPAAREYILDMLDEICNGEPAPEEQSLGNVQLVEDCVQELCRGITLLFDILEHGSEVEVYWCIRLLFRCWVYDRSLAKRLIWWYRQLLLTYSEDKDMIELLNNCLYSVEMNDPRAKPESM